MLLRAGWLLGSVATFIVLWGLAAQFGDSRYLPGPGIVLARMSAGFASGDLPFHTAMTLGRVAASFLIAMLIGAAIGIALGRAPRADRFFDGWLVLFLNLPALVVIILCYIWFGLSEVAAVTAVAINKIPNVAVTLREGARSLDRDYSEMARVYGFSAIATLRHVVLPQLAPFFAAAARSGLSLVWKIVLVVELLGRSNGVGFQLNTYFQLFDVASILAYAITFIIVVQLIELLVLQPWERHASRWRR